jgi:hypothetical protein
VSSKTPQRWDVEVAGLRHRVEVVDHALSREISWYVDDELVAQKKTSEDNVELEPGAGLETPGPEAGSEDPDPRGALGLKFTTLGRPRRVTWYEPTTTSAPRHTPYSAPAALTWSRSRGPRPRSTSRRCVTTRVDTPSSGWPWRSSASYSPCCSA